MSEEGVAKYYIVIGRWPEPETRPYLHLVGKPIRFDPESDINELSERLRHMYKSVLDPSLFEKRSEARAFASFLEKKGFEDVEVCAVVPLQKFVREPKLIVDEKENQ
ncbi:hypothetical protein MYX78_09240 [Acidobacteria bacterium AH-259-G07]|nr:hypothetical protein [Acidobacteria bacterium AH-259-G07]